MPVGPEVTSAPSRALVQTKRRREATGDMNFLGFTLICGKSREGRFLLKRRTGRDRMRAKLQEIKEELRQRMHQSIPEQGKWLRQVVTGFFNYHAVPTNSPALEAFRYYVTILWRRSLRRRSQKDAMTWERMTKLANDWLPGPRILHPWPSVRFAVRHPRWERYAQIAHVGSVRGALSNGRPYRDPGTARLSPEAAPILRDLLLRV
jgi:RNA-directed DNA polymerase